MTFEASESAMTAALYSALGQSVSYVAKDAATKTIYSIVYDGSELFGLESQASERVARARVKAVDVNMPKRDDCIEMSSGIVYVVDAVSKENNVEWRLTLRERDR